MARRMTTSMAKPPTRPLAAEQERKGDHGRNQVGFAPPCSIGGAADQKTGQRPGQGNDRRRQA